MKKWHITITENETGNVQLDIDTDVIVSAMEQDGGTLVFHVAQCPVKAHAAAMFGVTKSIEEATTQNPILGALMLLLDQREEEQEHAETVEEGQA